MQLCLVVFEASGQYYSTRYVPPQKPAALQGVKVLFEINQEVNPNEEEPMKNIEAAARKKARQMNIPHVINLD
jgi:hypothetical protein